MIRAVTSTLAAALLAITAAAQDLAAPPGTVVADPAGADIAGPEDRQAEDPAAADPASDDGAADGGGSPAPPRPAGEILRDLWRAEVAAGRTDLGFAAWAETLLAGQDPPDTQPARTRAVSGQWAARTGPVTLGAAGRVVTTFGAAIPTAFCSPLTVCYVELERGEELTDSPSWGDSVRWQVVAKTQGRDPATTVLEVKPAQDAETTNLVIPTDRRLYTITLVNDPDVHTPILAFAYPDTAARAIAGQVAAREAERLAEETRRAAERAARMARDGVETQAGPRVAEDLDFGFRIDGDATFRPVRVFADGERTYIDLHPRYRGAMPAIVPGAGEGNAALNTHVADGGTRLVADRVVDDVWLQSGRMRVRIRREAAR